MRSRTWISFLVRIVGLSLSVYVLLHVVDLNALIPAVLSVPWQLALITMGIALVRVYLTAIRWWLLSPDAAALTQWQCFRLMMGSVALNLFLPGTVGADVARSLLAMNEAKSERASTFLSVIVDRIIGLLSIIVLGLVACLLSPHFSERWFYFGIFAICGLCLFAVLYWIRIPQSRSSANSMLATMGKVGRVVANQLNRVFEALRGYKPPIHRIVSASAICIPIHILWFILVYLISRSLEIEISFFAISMVTTLVWLITILPVTMAGLGLRELGFVFLLSTQGVGDEQAAALALYQSAVVITIAMIGLPFLWVGRRRDKQNNQR